LLAQGIYYALKHLCTAGLLAAQATETQGIPATLAGLLLLQALQAVGVLAAGLLLGAGQRGGFLYGALVGAGNGFFYVLARYVTGKPISAITLLEEPIIPVAVGALGGMLGSLIWRPLPAPALPAGPPRLLPLGPARRQPSSLDGPIAWARVLAGVVVAVAGALWTDVIREFVLEASEGKLKIETHLQADLVTWEISALAIFAGGSLAGATTRNGVKQGLCVGACTGALLFGSQLASGNATFIAMVLLFASTLSLGLSGGWFGGELLPPILTRTRRRRTRAMLF
jgi:hypothetical protein